MTVAIALVVACASSSVPPPRESSNRAGSGYPGRCALLDVEQQNREGDLPSDGVVLVARYRPQSGADRPPIGLAFEVQRERADDLRAHLEQHSAVLCGPEPEGAPESYRVEVPPFEGQSGHAVDPSAQ